MMRNLKTSLSWIAILMVLAFGSMACREHEIRLHKTPKIQKVLNNRKARAHELQALKAKGLIGENNKGFITILKSSSIQTKEKILVEAENHDRKFIYNTVVAQNHLGDKGLVKVEDDFAKTHSGRVKKGDFIQTPSGKWIQK